MIVYNVQRRWFTEKADAEAYRKAEGLPPKYTAKIRIDDRDDLAGLLNALCTIPPAPKEQRDHYGIPDVVIKDRTVAPTHVIMGALVTPDCVPEFLLKDWTRTQPVRV